ncbi:protein ENL-like isoform X1 [Anneissia japonica]|uniref:protein ENL-like isoform X1 n=1 Tax=Anneissia japonica TaxID=1529436 RepID=UPI00142575D4|nr:protein ENL-like isoform X1 [Anneissia japonica]
MTTQCVQVKLDLGHRAAFRKTPTPEGFTHDWTVFVRGPDGNNIQHFVEKVIFFLHESFTRPKRVVREPPYSITEVGYAGFHLPIEVHFKNKEEPKKVVFEYDMFLHLENSPPVNHIRYEKLTFRNPTEDFRRKLLKGGGVGILPDAPDLNPGTFETTTTTSEETTSFPVHTLEVPKVKGKPHAAASNALAAKKSKEKKESSSRSPVATKPSKGKEPKSITPKESKPKDPNKQSVKRQSSTSSVPEQVKKRKKSSSGSKNGEKSEKISSSEKVKLKEKSQKVKQPRVISNEPLFKPEAVLERKNKTKPEPLKKVLPPFEAELSTEEIEDVPSPGSSTSFSSFPNKQSGGALNTLMQEFMQESDNEDLDDSSEIVTTPFQSGPYKAALSDDSDNEEPAQLESPAPTPPPPPPVEKPKVVQKSIKKKATNGKKSRVSEKKERTDIKKVKTASNKKSDLDELTHLHQRLMSLQNREHLQKVVDLIEETGLFQITTSTFDFDLCSLDKSTIQKLQNCIETLVM